VPCRVQGAAGGEAEVRDAHGRHLFNGRGARTEDADATMPESRRIVIRETFRVNAKGWISGPVC